MVQVHYQRRVTENNVCNSWSAGLCKDAVRWFDLDMTQLAIRAKYSFIDLCSHQWTFLETNQIYLTMDDSDEEGILK